ncbi:Slp family lipoprotein [Sphingomonas sp.]|uniref:Slp family lipoprotein n=1 Tax=Sphingomonas sp. TaxID=28214 RepID=UPI003B3A1014
MSRSSSPILPQARVTLLRRLSAPVSLCLILAGCAGGSGTPGPRSSAIAPSAPAPSAPAPASSAPDDLTALRAAAAAPLTPDQALQGRARGQRIRWAGTVHHIAPSDSGVCLTLSYLPSDADGAPRWADGANAAPQAFRACTAGRYDPALVGNATSVTILGRIVGTGDIGMGGERSPGPIVAIERLFRWSDCLSGDTDPLCRRGFVAPIASSAG